MINKRRIKKSFSTHASTYDQSAHFQQKVAGEVVEHVKALGIRPNRILDIGTGTGTIALELKKLFASATVQACDIACGMVIVAKAKGDELFCDHLDFIGADAEYLPYRGETFDLVISSLTYQWLNNWRCAMKEVLRVLQIGGMFFFTALGSKTLFELRDSYIRSYRELGNSGVSHLHKFIDENTLHELLAEEGFFEISVKSRFEKKYHNGVKDLLVNLKAIGAQNASQYSPLGLGKPRVFRRMVDIYEERYGNGLSIPATYQLLYGFGRKV